MLGTYPSLPTGIRIGNYQFSAPEMMPDSAGLAALFCEGPGLYAILAPPSLLTPQYRVIYVGESQTIYGRATSTHENHSSWKQQSGTIYRAFYSMPDSTQAQRQVVESALISAFNPPCNQRLSFDVGRLTDLLGRKA